MSNLIEFLLYVLLMALPFFLIWLFFRQTRKRTVGQLKLLADDMARIAAPLVYPSRDGVRFVFTDSSSEISYPTKPKLVGGNWILRGSIVSPDAVLEERIFFCVPKHVTLLRLGKVGDRWVLVDEQNTIVYGSGSERVTIVEPM